MKILIKIRKNISTHINHLAIGNSGNGNCMEMENGSGKRKQSKLDANECYRVKPMII